LSGVQYLTTDVDKDPFVQHLWITDLSKVEDFIGYTSQRGVEASMFGDITDSTVRQFCRVLSNDDGERIPYRERMADVYVSGCGMIEHHCVNTNLTIWGELSVYYAYFKGNSAIYITDEDDDPDESLFRVSDILMGTYVHMFNCKKLSFSLDYLRRKHCKWLGDFRNNLLVYASTRAYLLNHIVGAK
jgi:hypothetical protein